MSDTQDMIARARATMAQGELSMLRAGAQHDQAWALLRDHESDLERIVESERMEDADDYRLLLLAGAYVLAEQATRRWESEQARFSASIEALEQSLQDADD